jgi:hypothetical protein
MIINPVTMRSTLKARGANGANFSIMIVSPLFLKRPIRIVSRLQGKAYRRKKSAAFRKAA